MTLIDQLKWFHALRFPDGCETPGRFGERWPPNYTVLGVLRLIQHLDLGRARCLDIGTMDGIVAWALAARGAGEVTATDIAPREGFRLAQALLGPAVRYRVPFVVADLPKAAPEHDLIVYAGVLYHVFDPLPSLVRLRMNLRRGGLLLLETQYLAGEGRARLSFSPAERSGASIHANTFFRPSWPALRGMLEVAGFEVVVSIATLGRICVLARAERPGAIRATTPMVRQVLARYRDYANYREDVDYAAMDADATEAAIGYDGPRGDFVLDASAYRAHLPFMPDWRPTAAVRARVRLADWRSRLNVALARGRMMPHWPGEG